VDHHAITDECHHATPSQCTFPETFRETERVHAPNLANSKVLPSGDLPFAYRTAQIPPKMSAFGGEPDEKAIFEGSCSAHALLVDATALIQTP
jgi:hypothetical protein